MDFNQLQSIRIWYNPYVINMYTGIDQDIPISVSFLDIK